MKKILIIEDDPVIREELALLLANEGYRTEAVTDFTAERTWSSWTWASPFGTDCPSARTSGSPAPPPSS